MSQKAAALHGPLLVSLKDGDGSAHALISHSLNGVISNDCGSVTKSDFFPGTGSGVSRSGTVFPIGAAACLSCSIANVATVSVLNKFCKVVSLCFSAVLWK